MVDGAQVEVAKTVVMEETTGAVEAMVGATGGVGEAVVGAIGAGLAAVVAVIGAGEEGAAGLAWVGTAVLRAAVKAKTHPSKATPSPLSRGASCPIGASTQASGEQWT